MLCLAMAASEFVVASETPTDIQLKLAELFADTNVSEEIPYGGKPQPKKSWEQDMDLRAAKHRVLGIAH